MLSVETSYTVLWMRSKAVCGEDLSSREDIRPDAENGWRSYWWNKPEIGAWPELEPMPRLKYKFGRKIATLSHTQLNKHK